MNHVFTVTTGFTVPDETVVYPFLNSKDIKSQLPWDLSEGASLAVGEIAPVSHSKIHICPIVTLITWVIAGELWITMKDPVSPEPYTVQLQPEQAALTRPGTFLQHRNTQTVPCRVLYIVSPAHVFVVDEQQAFTYDDAIVTDADWLTLARQGWTIPEAADLDRIHRDRARALHYLQTHKSQQPFGS